MQGANLERARRIAFHLKRAHRPGTPEYRYWLMLERGIVREMLRVGRSASRSQPPQPEK